jgi:protein TonB
MFRVPGLISEASGSLGGINSAARRYEEWEPRRDAGAPGARRKEADMFNDALFVPERGARRKAVAWPVSVLLHAAFALLVVTYPLLSVGELPKVESVGVFLAPPPPVPPPPPPKARGGNPGGRARIKPVHALPAAAPGALVFLGEIPDGIVEESLGGDGLESGIEGGFDYGDVGAWPKLLAGEEIYRVVGEEQVPVRVAGEVRPPRLVRRVEPMYPEIARQARVEGIVILEATTDEYGRVRNIRVLRSIPLLDQAALDAVREWVYEPMVINGRPRAVVFTVTVRFKLD